MKLAEIASGIAAHLKRFEADKGINKPFAGYGTRQYYGPYSWAAGSRVGVRYISYQGDYYLTKADAEKYLAWLDAGNVGRHPRALKPST